MACGQATEQGDCSAFKANIPHCCKRDPRVVDLVPGAPYNMQFGNCCKGGVLTSWVQDPLNAVASFQITVGHSGTSNKTVKAPKNFTLKAPGPGYSCGLAQEVKPPTRFISLDGRRTTQAHGKSFQCFLSFWRHNYDTLSSFFCSDLECDMHIFAVCCSKSSNLLCFTFIVLQWDNS